MLDQLTNDQSLLNASFQGQGLNVLDTLNSFNSNGTLLKQINNAPFSNTLEQILNARQPIENLPSGQYLTLGQLSGNLVNKNEIDNWVGSVSVNQVKINTDPNIYLLRKMNEKKVDIEEALNLTLLRAQTPVPPGDIVIRQEGGIIDKPAPPIVIRSQEDRPKTPSPVVLAEKHRSVQPIGEKVIVIPGKRLPPPPRRVILEKLPRLPAKAAPIHVYRWVLENKKIKRRVRYEKMPDPVVPEVKNLIIEWEPYKTNIIRRVYTNGVYREDPNLYFQKYGKHLVDTQTLPSSILNIPAPNGYVYAENFNYQYELEGDIDALIGLDLSKYGLGDYQNFINNYKNNKNNNFASTSMSVAERILYGIFNKLDTNNDGKITEQEAIQGLLDINNQLNLNLSVDNIREFHNRADLDKNGIVDIYEFIKYFNL